MANNKKEFHVEIYGLEIPENVAKNIEKDIRRVVFNHLADMDLKGSCVIEDLPKELAARLGGSLGGAAIRIK